jgi:hypothetical protein
MTASLLNHMLDFKTASAGARSACGRYGAGRLLATGARVYALGFTTNLTLVDCSRCKATDRFRKAAAAQQTETV